MMDGLADHVLRDEHWARLDAVGTVIDRVPLTRLDDERAATVLADADVLLGHWGCPTLHEEVLAQAPHLGLFAYAAGTVKWQVVDAVWDRDIVVTSAAAANAVPVAEYTVAMVVLANKGVPLFAARERDRSAIVPLDRTRVGNLGKRVGLVGASFVGRLVIELLAPYDVDIAVSDPYLSAADAQALGVQHLDLDELCSWFYVLSLHAPDLPATRHMIAAPQLARLHDGVTLINTAEAPVDHDALLGRSPPAGCGDPRRHDPEPLPRIPVPHAPVGAATRTSPRWALRCRLADLAVTDRAVRQASHRSTASRADLDRIARRRDRTDRPGRLRPGSAPSPSRADHRRGGSSGRAAGLQAVEWGGDRHVPPGDERAVAGGPPQSGARPHDRLLRVVPVLRRADAPSLGAVLDTTEALGTSMVRVWCPFGVEPRRPPTGSARDRSVGRGAATRPRLLNLPRVPRRHPHRHRRPRGSCSARSGR
jgi:phosphoglycerate dehydrogenase-like enzyme